MGNHSASRQKERPEAGAVIDRLARFTGGELVDPTAFGGGADRARVGMRAQTVAYGYLAVVDEYEQPYTGAVWSTLTVSLPCPVTPITIDHSSVLGRPGVPFPGAYGLRSADPEFDAQYSVNAADPATAITLITSKLRDVLIRRPIQRLAFDRARLLLRTFDGVEASIETIDWLDALACAVLAATPAFVMRAAGATLPPLPRTFPRGLYGLDEPEDMGPRARAVAAFMSRFAFADRRRAYGR